MSDTEDVEQAGFDAIADSAQKLYPGQEGLFYRTVIPYALGGNDPLDGVEVWKSERGIPHWHYITYGFSELYEKESDNEAESGYGFELTFRLKRGPEEEPPAWPVNLLQNLARYVFSTGNVFGPGHHINCNGPIALETDTKITALGFRRDPEMGELDTRNGHLRFLQAVGITSDEMDALMCWNGEKFLAALEKNLPLCITDLARSSQMEKAAFQETWQTGMEEDGSSTSYLYIDKVEMALEEERAYLCLGVGHGRTLSNMLRARVGKGRDLYLYGTEVAIQFLPGDTAATVEDDLLILSLPEQTLAELSMVLQRHTGVYPLSSFPLTIELVPTEITDQNGNVLEVIE